MNKALIMKRIVEEVKLYSPDLDIYADKYNTIHIEGESISDYYWSWDKQRTTGTPYMSFHGFGSGAYSGSQSFPVRKDGTMAFDKIAQRILAAREYYISVARRRKMWEANDDDARTLSKDFSDTFSNVKASGTKEGFFKVTLREEVSYAQAVEIANILKRV